MSFFGRLGGSMPYVKWNELNEDWILDTVKKLSEDWLQYHASWNEWRNNTNEAFQSLHDYVMNYFEALDVDEEINNKINAMIADGSFTALIAPIIPDIVTAWLDEHITPTTPPVDKSLTISGAAADAKAAGYRIRDLERFNAGNILPTSERTITTNGITFSNNNDDSYTVSGTATARANFNIVAMPDALPAGFEAGKSITIFYNGHNKVALQLFKAVGGQYSSSSFASLNGDYSVTPFVVEVPEDATGILIRLSVPTSTDIELPVIVAPAILNTLSNQEITSILKSVEPASVFVEENKIYNAYNIMPKRTDIITHNGITYTPEGDGSYKVEGIATSRSYYNIYNNAVELPEGISPGRPITIYYNGYDKVQFQIYKTVSGQPGSSPFVNLIGDYSEGYTTIVPEDTEGAVIRITVRGEEAIEEPLIVMPQFLNAKSNPQLTKEVNEIAAYRVPIKYAAFGDSLTLSAVWDDNPATHWYQADLINQIPTRIANAIGSNNFANYGVGGSRFVQQQPGDDIIGDKVKSIDLSDVNLLTLGGGGNDRSTALGDGDTATPNDGTICGAVADIFEHLNNLYPEMQIIMYGVSPQPISTETAPEYIYTRVFGGGWSLNTYFEEMRKLCKRYGVGFIDWYDCTLILQWGKLSGGYSENLRNWSHPKNQNTYRMMGNYLAGKVSAIFNN